MVYFAEADADDGLQDWQLDIGSEIREEGSDEYGVPVLWAKGWQSKREPEEWLYRPIGSIREEKERKLIPYFAFANAGEKDMRVWIPMKG